MPNRIYSVYSAVAGWVSRHSVLTLLIGLVCLAAYTGVIGLAGVLAQKHGYAKDLRDRLVGYLDVLGERDPWSERVTGFHTLELARVHIGNGLGYGGGIEEVAGNIIFASSKGRLGYLDAKHRAHSLDVTVPMNLEGLRQDPHYRDPLYAIDTLRVADLLAVERAPGKYTLYVSHHV